MSLLNISSHIFKIVYNNKNKTENDIRSHDIHFSGTIFEDVFVSFERKRESQSDSFICSADIVVNGPWSKRVYARKSSTILNGKESH